MHAPYKFLAPVNTSYSYIFVAVCFCFAFCLFRLFVCLFFVCFLFCLGFLCVFLGGWRVAYPFLSITNYQNRELLHKSKFITTFRMDKIMVIRIDFLKPIFKSKENAPQQKLNIL